MNQLGEGTM